MAVFTIDLLGAPRVTLAGRPLDLRVRKELALLAYLAIEAGRPLRRDHLLALLWPDLPEDAARNNLRVVLAGLRRALGDTADAVLRIDRQLVQFLPQPDMVVDALIVRGLLDTVRTHSHAAVESCDACVARLVEAVERFGGEFLHGFNLPDSVPFEEWVTVQRERMHQGQLDALEALTGAAELRGDHADQCSYARRQLVLEPWRESAYAQLMRGLWAGGQRGAALEQFEVCRRVLADELGIEPGAELAALAERLRSPGVPPSHAVPLPPAPIAHHPAPGWYDVPEVARLYGRDDELARLARWLCDDRCRLVGVLGIGGVGKTTLAAAATAAVAGDFAAVAWRTLVNAPPLDELVRDVLGQLTPGSQLMLPPDPSGQIGLLLAALRGVRCLLVLDNLESLLRADEPGVMRPGYEGYAQLLRAVAERSHQSCVLLTSRERPQGLARLEEDTPLVRLLSLGGLDAAAGTELLAARGLREGDGAVGALVRCYSGNPLALRLVAQTVREVFDGDIGAFLATETPIFDDIGAVLDQQLARLAPLEYELLLWLAILRQPTPVNTLRAYLVRPEPQRAVVEAARALLRRSLVARSGGGLVLQNVVTEYLTDRLTTRVATEFDQGPLDWLHRYALLTTGAPEYVRQSQLRLLVEPVAQQLATAHGRAGIESRARSLLDTLRAAGPRRPSYVAGNLLNLMNLLQIDIQGFDFSNLCVWQADLREVAAFDVNFTGADLAHGAFSDTFDSVNCVAVSPDGALLAAGSNNGVVGVWRIADGQRHAMFTGHGPTIWSIAFSPDGRVLAIASIDGTLRLWDVARDEPIMALEGHSQIARSVAWVPGTSLLVTGGADAALRVWETREGRCIQMLEGHTVRVRSLAVDPSGAWVAVADGGTVVQLRRLADGGDIMTLTHPQAVHCVAWSPDGRQLITGCHDGITRVWDAGDRQLVRQLEGHQREVYSVRWRPDGSMIATGSADTTIRLWDAVSGEPLRVLRDHIDTVHGLDWSPDGALLISAGHDQVIRMWSAESGEALRVLQGNAAGVLSLAFSSDSTTLYSTQGHVLHVWDMPLRRRRRILRGHRDVVSSVRISRDGAYLASASRDLVLRVWDAASGHVRHELSGHTNMVQALAWSSDGRMLASGGHDASVRLWDGRNGQLLHILSGHTGWVESVCFSTDGALLVSGSADGTVRLWDAAAGREIHCLTTPRRTTVRCVAVSPDGALLAYAGDDGVQVVDMPSGRPVHVLAPGKVICSLAWSPDSTRLATGSADWVVRLWERDGWTARAIGKHQAWISALSWSPDGTLLISSSTDGEIALWDGRSGARAGELQDDGPYAGMEITGVTGITAAQRASLVALGAIDGGRDAGI